MRRANATLFLISTTIFAGPSISLGERPAVTRAESDADRIVQLKSGFSKAERRDFYHSSFGSEMLPKDSMLALVNPNTQRPLLDDLDRFGLSSDPSGPDGLPIGFSVAPTRASPSQQLMIGVNCAICHVGELRYRGKSVRVDGAPSQFDNARFVTEFGQSVGATLKDPERLYEFLRRLRAIGNKSEGATAAKGKEDFENLRITYANAIKQLASRLEYFQRLAELAKVGGTPFGPGPGRADTWVTARNILFSDHATPATSPSSYPHLWGYDDAKWLTWNGTTRSGAERDVATALGMMTFFNPRTHQSFVSPQALIHTDRLVSELKSPKWPGRVFGRIDRARFSRGKKLYKTHCACCHERRTFVSVDEVGTDPEHLKNFGLPVGERPFREAFADEMRKFKERAYDDNDVPQDEIKRFEKDRPNQWRETSAYAARPLNGIWATAPYLHNGSVPTIYDLLLPQVRRPKKFAVGSLDYDPTRLGFISDMTNKELFPFDTALVGNSNQGHEYGTDMDESERHDLLEYLKGI